MLFSKAISRKRRKGFLGNCRIANFRFNLRDIFIEVFFPAIYNVKFPSFLLVLLYGVCVLVGLGRCEAWNHEYGRVGGTRHLHLIRLQVHRVPQASLILLQRACTENDENDLL
jgi:hypothetical protein